MSEEPGQRPEVVVPLQQPAEILTQTPATPPAVHVAEYEQFESCSRGFNPEEVATNNANTNEFIYVNFLIEAH